MNNTTRFKIFVILAALVIIIVGVVWFYPREHSSKVPHVKRDASTKQASRSAQQAMPVSSTPSSGTTNTERPEAYPHLLSAFRDNVDSCNRKWPLNLSAEQLADFRASYLSLVTKRLEIEARISQIAKTGDNSYRVAIPAYKDEGIKLRDAMARDVEQLLASVGKEQYIDNVETFLDANNNNWGVTDQEIIIKYAPSTDTYKILTSFYDVSPFIGFGKATTDANLGSDNLMHYYYIIKKINGYEN